MDYIFTPFFLLKDNLKKNLKERFFLLVYAFFLVYMLLKSLQDFNKLDAASVPCPSLRKGHQIRAFIGTYPCGAGF